MNLPLRPGLKAVLLLLLMAAIGALIVLPTRPIAAHGGDARDRRAALASQSPSPSLSTVQLDSGNYFVSEGSQQVSVTVTRVGDASAAATVNYTTADADGSNNCNVFTGAASSRCDYLPTIGTLRFAAGEISRNISIPLIDDSYTDGDEGFIIILNNPTGTTIGAKSTAQITIIDNDSRGAANPIDPADFFVHQNYIDFLNRQPDSGGLAFWTNEITSCGANPGCVEVKRINVSASFFLSIEFQDTGFLVERIYKTAYGDADGASALGAPHVLKVPNIRLNEFVPDAQEISQGVVVLQPGWEQQLENNKNAFAAEFVTRPRFLAAFPSTMTAAQFVDSLNANAGNPLSTTERNQLLTDLTNGGRTRAQVLRTIAESQNLNAAEFNRAFVLMQYFGYLRRDPNGGQDSDYTGYDFWLTKLNQFGGNYINAEMVKAFITSIEYRQRFGPTFGGTTPNQPPIASAGPNQTITLPNTANLIGVNADDGLPTGTLISAWSKVSGPGTVIFSNASSPATSAIFSAPGAYVLRLSADDSEFVRSADVTVTVNPDPTPIPPDPASSAPTLDPTTTTSIGDATKFLYSGPNPIQTGVAPGALLQTRAAVLRGRVLDRSGAPLPNVKITIQDHGEYGQTFTRADGRFDLAVNGGELLAVRYDKAGFLPANRRMFVPLQDYGLYPDVVLIGYDAQVTLIDLNANVPIQVARANAVTDADGTRRETLFFPQGTSATMVMPDSSTRPLTTLHVRSTEFTVGPNGPTAMPGDLPAASGYTYATEFTTDEAVAAGASSVRFSPSIVSYNENFLNLPTGTIVPVGSYDRNTNIWMPEDNGRVIKILSVSGGTVSLDIDGSNNAASAASLAALNISNAELQQLATLYQAGQTLWRMPLIHFSAWDKNFSYGPPPGSRPPNLTPPDQGKGPDDIRNRTKLSGYGDIEPQNRSFGEDIGIAGTPFTLHYASDRVPGVAESTTFAIPLSGPTLPPGVKRIDLEIMIAGQLVTQSFGASPNQKFTFTWNGKDGYGRTIYGKQVMTARVGYTYDAVYMESEQFDQSFASLSGVPITGSRARQEITLWQEMRWRVGSFDARGLGLGGWTLDVHHLYDPGSTTLYLGNGDKRSNQLPSRMTASLFAGTGIRGFNGDGLSSFQTQLQFPEAVAVPPDNPAGLYVADSSPQTGQSRIRTFGGATATAVGGGNCGSPDCGDGGPATQAQLSAALDVYAGSSATNLPILYISTGERIRRVDSAGIITTVAGSGVAGYSGDFGPAILAQLRSAHGVRLSPDGSFYIADTGNHCIRRVSPRGIITTIAGNGAAGFSGDGGPARQAQLNNPIRLAIGPDESIYFTDTGNHRIRRIGPDGIINTVAGTGVAGFSGDGGPATQAQLSSPAGIDIARDGTLYISDTGNNRVRSVSTESIITTVAGNAATDTKAGGAPATQSHIGGPSSIALKPDGSFWIAQREQGYVVRSSLYLPDFRVSASLQDLTSEDGRFIYSFNLNGRHLLTTDTFSGAQLFKFDYDANGLLTSITDQNGNVTTIERDQSGNPTAIVAPFGQRTTLAVNADAFLTSVTNPASEVTQLGYGTGGLLTSITGPKGNTYNMTYDSQGLLVSAQHPGGGGETLSQSLLSRGRQVTMTSSLGRVSKYAVENLLNLTQRFTTTFTDNTQSQRDEATDGTRKFTEPSGMITTRLEGPTAGFGMMAPVAINQTVATPGGLNLTTSTSRVANLSSGPNNLRSLTSWNDETRVNGRAYTSSYQRSTFTLTNTSPENRTVTTMTDALGRVVQYQIAGLNPVNYAYDSRGRRVSSVNGSRVSSLTYNAAGYLSSVADPLNRTTSFGYDAVGRITSQTQPGNRVSTFAYDANGNMISTTPPGKTAHIFAYNTFDQPATYSMPAVTGGGTNTFGFTYNNDRQLTRVTRPDGTSIDRAYDSAGRLSTLTIPTGQYSFAYGGTSGLLTSVTAPGGSGLSFTYDGSLLKSFTWTGTVAGDVGFTLDDNFRVISESVNGANPIGFQYDNDGLRTSAGGLVLTHNASNGLVTSTTLGNVADRFTYNSFAEVANYSAAYNDTGFFSQQFARDDLGRITKKTEAVDGVTTVYDYTYDVAGRLSKVVVNGDTNNPRAIYGYDINGNRTNATFGNLSLNGTYDAQDRLTQYGSTTYAYTPNGDLLSKTEGAQVTQYTYDAMGNLSHVTLPNSKQIDYVVDPSNRRIGRKVNGVLGQGFLYDARVRVVAELDGSNSVVSRFVYATHRTVPDYMIKSGVAYRLITDQLGSVRVVINTASGGVAQRMDYDEFGNVIQDTNPGFQPFGFGAGLYDPDTGLVRFGARDYDAGPGRWLTRDPVGFDSGETNLYAYVLNDPIDNTDRSGLGIGANVQPGWANWWLYESVVPGPYGAPVSEWRRRGPTYGDPMKYTEAEGGLAMWTERAAVGTAFFASGTAYTAMAYEWAVAGAAEATAASEAAAAEAALAEAAAAERAAQATRLARWPEMANMRPYNAPTNYPIRYIPYGR